MAPPDARKIKDEAAQLVARGKWQKALEHYRELERLEPDDGGWPQRCGELLRRIGRPRDAIDVLTRAADTYSRRGFLLKAVAVCQVILEIDPTHTEVQRRLASLHAARLQRPSRMQTVVAAAVPPSSSPGSAIDPPRGAEPPAEVEFTPRSKTLVGPAPMRGARTALPTVPLADVELARAVPGARKSSEIRPVGASAAYEIPLGDEDSASFDEESSALRTARSVLPRTPLFSSLDEARLRSLIERVQLVRLAPGQVLFRRGDAADALYVVASGEVAVRAGAGGGAEVEVARLREGAFFGEIALLADQPRGATIAATVDAQVLAIPRPVIDGVIAGAPDVLQVLLRFMRDRLVETLIETDPLFAPFSGPDRRALAARFRFVEAEPGVALETQGERAPGLFIVLCGVADLLLDGVRVGARSSGDIVGETSLLRGTPSLASVVARGKLLLLELPRTDFQEVIMTHPQVLEYIGALADDRRRELEEIRRGGSAPGRLRVV